MSIFSKTVFVVTKIFRIWTMGVITFHIHFRAMAASDINRQAVSGKLDWENSAILESRA